MKQKILVTGGSGLLGSYLIRWLRQKGYANITATYQHSMDTIPSDICDGIKWLKLILPDKEQSYEITQGQEWVIHAAGFVSYKSSDKFRLLDINKTGTAQMVNAALAHSVAHFVYVGSIGALGREYNHVSLNESTPWLENEYTSGYGLSKYLGELEAWRGAAEGLNVSVILPSIILGSGNWHRSSLQLVDRIAHKAGWFPGGRTGFVDVRDVTQFISLLLEKSKGGERWLLNGADMTYADVFHQIAAQLELKKTFRPAPKWLAKTMLLFGNIIHGGGTGVELLNQSYGTFSYDAAKSLGMEGFRYRDIGETIRDVSIAYKAGAGLEKVLAF
jgi:dihydroflavonol-4-reductase